MQPPREPLLLPGVTSENSPEVREEHASISEQIAEVADHRQSNNERQKKLAEQISKPLETNDGALTETPADPASGFEGFEAGEIQNAELTCHRLELGIRDRIGSFLPKYRADQARLTAAASEEKENFEASLFESLNDLGYDFDQAVFAKKIPPMFHHKNHRWVALMQKVRTTNAYSAGDMEKTNRRGREELVRLIEAAKQNMLSKAGLAVA